ncbi:PEP-CTERM sorting domain-containing protein [uncultured Rhodoblastus sp.]|uniref:PEP-CTERM sorting domain-containing protein n=1 Tax=uncultured Rhodoblastus sp. TaxID=543037 RepID=UPI0025F240C0|nr:PEP-CTERM sorting domain-containing protein [uncultured Rhodoblastus sp.]
MCNRGILLATSLLGCAALALPAQASTIISPEGYPYEYIDAEYLIVHNGQLVATPPLAYSGPGGTVSITSWPAVVLQASAFHSTNSATIFYYFSVTGPDSTALVPISITGTLSGDSTPDPVHGDNAGAYAELRVNAFDQDRIYVSTLNGLEPFVGSWSGSLHVSAIADGRANGIYIYTVAEGLSAHAYADPIISIDPGFADYSIHLSNGIGNALPTGVPEPSTWAMMIVGGFALAGLSRGRRKNAVSLA